MRLRKLPGNIWSMCLSGTVKHALAIRIKENRGKMLELEGGRSKDLTGRQDKEIRI